MMTALCVARKLSAVVMMWGLAAVCVGDTTNTVASFDLDSDAAPTQTGFLGIGTAGGTTNGISLTMSAMLGTRDRGGYSNLVGHPYADVLRDFTFVGNDVAATFSIAGLTANAKHNITIFSYDENSNLGTHKWYKDRIVAANLVKTITPLAADPETGYFTLSNLVSDASGAITLVCRPTQQFRFNGMSIDEIASTGPAIQVLGGSPPSAVANGTFAPATVNGTDFGITAFGGPALDRTFVITNVGTTTLDLTGTPDLVAISGAPEFSVTTQPGTDPIPVGDTASFVVSFARTNGGTKTATISIDSDDTDATPFTFVVQCSALPSNTIAAFDLDSQTSGDTAYLHTQTGFLSIYETLSGTTNGVTLDISGFALYRDRKEENKLLGYRYADVLRDAGFASSSATFDLSGLTPNTKHDVTIFSYDADGASMEHKWYEGSVDPGNLLKTITPNGTDPATGFFTLTNLVADGSGAIRIVGYTGGNYCLFNGMIVAEGESAVTGIGWTFPASSNLTASSAICSATVDADLDDTVLVWDTADKGDTNTTDWTYSRSLGPTNAGVVTGQATNLLSDTEYTWRLYGENATSDGWSTPSTFCTALTPAQNPVFTGVEQVAWDSLALSWEDHASNETAYILQRSDAGPSGPYTAIATLAANATTFTNRAILTVDPLYYRLAATNAANGSATSFAACQTNATSDPGWDLVAAFDLDSNQPGAFYTQPGCLSLHNYPSGATNGITLNSSHTFDGHRDRTEKNAILGHPWASMLRDFVFDYAGGTFDLSGLSKNTEHVIVVFAYDVDHSLDPVNWYTNAISGSPLASHPSAGNNDVYFFLTNVVSDAGGELHIIADGELRFNGMVVGEIPRPPAGTIFLMR